MDNPGTNFTLVDRNFGINPNLLNAPKTLQDLAVQYWNKKHILNKKEQELENPEDTSKLKSFLNSFLADILLFATTTYNSDYNSSDIMSCMDSLS